MDAQYFIDKFTAIPDRKWCMGNDTDKSGGRHCALGHCGWRGWTESGDEIFTPEAIALWAVLPRVVHINDGGHPQYRQRSIKERVLAALHDVKGDL